MLKFLLISFLIFFVVYKVIGFVFRLMLRSSVNYQQQQQQQQSRYRYSSNGQSTGRRPADGNVNIDYVPKDENEKAKKDNYKGGEYIDYEEVK